jgi:predicted Zn-dependent peptidase
MKRAVMILGMLLLAAIQAAPVAAQGELKLPPYKKVVLKNGLTLLLMEQHEVPIVSFEVVLRSGAVADPAGKEGLASVTVALLRKGTKTRTAEQFSAELDFVGGTFFSGANTDSSSVSSEFLKKDLSTGLELLSDVLLNATFPQEEVTKLLKQRVDEIKAQKDQAQGVVGRYFNAFLYGKHPYARPSGGDERSLAAIARDDIVKFYEAHYVPGNAILAVVGDFAAAEMEKLLTAKFSAWAARPAAAAKIPDVLSVQGKKLLLVDKPDATATYFFIGNVGIARNNPDRVWIDVVNTLFGGRFTSMLNDALRVKSGLTYGASSFFDERRVRGPFAIASFTRNDKTVEALDMALDILKRLHEKGISEEELKSAKNYIKGQFPPNIETTDRLADLIAELEFHGLNEQEINTFYSKVDAMTVMDARRIIRQYFPLDNLVFVLVGKAAEIESAVKKYAPTMEKKVITEPGF